MTGSNVSSTETNPRGWAGSARNEGSSTGPITRLLTTDRGDDLRPTSIITIAASGTSGATQATGQIVEWNTSHSAYADGATTVSYTHLRAHETDS